MSTQLGSARRAPAIPVPGGRRLGLTRAVWRPGAVRVGAGLTALVAVSAHVRTRALGAPFWEDEAISVGVASHRLAAIPGVLREDGSPPLYYVLLHAWMRAFGSSEAATHALSVVFAVACVPVALWLGWMLFGERAGWACAALAALNPLLTTYAQETRMYSLVALLSLLAAAAFVAVFLQRRRGFVPVLGVALAGLLYTHNWGVFAVAAALLVAGAISVCSPGRRALALDAAAAFATAGALYAPWLPTVLYQAAHTGAPWAHIPHAGSLTRAVHQLSWGPGPLVALGVAAGAALWRGEAPDRRAAGALLLLGTLTLLAAWGYAQHNRAWSPRYEIILLGPALLLSALLLARAGPAGVVALAIVVFAWAGQPPYASLAHKSNIRTVAAGLTARLRPGDLIVAAQPETGPLLRYALGGGFRYADPAGRVADPRVMDWRDALARLRAAGTAPVLALADELRPGARVAFVVPPGHGYGTTPWRHAVRLAAAHLGAALARDRALRRVAVVPPGQRGTRVTLRAVVYQRRG